MTQCQHCQTLLILVLELQPKVGDVNLLEEERRTDEGTDNAMGSMRIYKKDVRKMVRMILQDRKRRERDREREIECVSV